LCCLFRELLVPTRTKTKEEKEEPNF